MKVLRKELREREKKAMESILSRAEVKEEKTLLSEYFEKSTGW